MIRLGGHGLPVGGEDPFAFAKAHVAFGYGAAYGPDASTSDSRRLVDIERAFAEADVTIAEYGIWRNIVTPDRGDRQLALDFASEKLAVADAVGARCAVTWLGSYKAGTKIEAAAANFSDEAFDVAVQSIQQVIDTVKPKRAKFCVEMMQNSVPDSIDSYLQLIRAVDRDAFAVHFDPVNWIFTPRTYWRTGALIEELFMRLGAIVVSCHAKDIILRDQAALHFDEVVPGKGVLDYRTYLSLLDRMPTEVPLMIEHLEPAQYAEARDAIYAAGDVAWVQFKHRP